MTSYETLVPEPTDGYLRHDILVLDGNLDGFSHPRDILEIEIDEDGVVAIGTRWEATNSDGIPMEVWHGRTRRYTLAVGPGVVPLAAMREQFEDGKPIPTLIDRIRAGLTVEWDGNNMRGVLTEDAANAESDLTHLLENETLTTEAWSIWDESEWVDNEARDWIKATTTDEEVDAYLVKVRENAPGDNVILEGDAREHLIELRDEKRDAAS